MNIDVTKTSMKIDAERLESWKFMSDLRKSVKICELCALTTGEHRCGKNIDENGCGTLGIMDIHAWFRKIDENG